MAFEIAKAGWVQRQSTVLKRWKRNWLVLYHDGSLKYFQSPDDPTAEDAIRMPSRCRAVYEDHQVIGDPPAGFGRTCMLSLELSKDTTWTFCAESPDDMKAWCLVLKEACTMPERTPRFDPGPPIPGVPYPGQIIAYPGEHYGAHPPTYVIQDGNRIVYSDGSYRRRRDVNDGLLGGMLLGGLMWGPLLWW